MPLNDASVEQQYKIHSLESWCNLLYLILSLYDYKISQVQRVIDCLKECNSKPKLKFLDRVWRCTEVKLCDGQSSGGVAR